MEEQIVLEKSKTSELEEKGDVDHVVHFIFQVRESKAERNKVPCTKSHKTDNYKESIQDFSSVIGPMKNMEIYPKYLTTTTKGLLKLLKCLQENIQI